MDIKVLYVDSDGLNQEHSEAADSIKFLSYKTANKELTDTKLGKLIDGADAADEHIHDGRYYRENEHINISSGAGDAAKPLITDAAGKIDNSFLHLDTINTSLDHGQLQGLGDDDHTQYIRVDGTRAFTGVQSYNSQPTFNNDLQIVTKKYVDDIQYRSEWYPLSAKDYIVNNTLTPPTEVLNDVYVLSHDGGTPHANWDGAAAGDIVRFDGTVWVKTTPTTGTKISVDDENDVAYYLYSGAAWTPKYAEVTTASTGLEKVGFDIRIAAAAAGDGLGYASGILSVNVDNSSLEISSDTVRVKADGINDTHIDWGTGVNQVSGIDIPLADAGNYFPNDNVEQALQFLAQEILTPGVEYTSAGVTKADLVFVSANNTVSTFSTITNNTVCVGLASTTQSNGNQVTVVKDSTVLTGVLTGAVAGTPYYWTGSGLSTSMPTGTGGNVWRVGVAKNATDLDVNVQHVKKNA